MPAIVRNLLLATIVLDASSMREADASEADDQYAVAAGHYARGRWKLAADEFQAFLDDHPQHAGATEALFFMAEALVQTAQYEPARARYRDFLTRADDHRYRKQARFRAAEAAYLSGQLDVARIEFEPFALDYSDDPLNAYVLPYLGKIALDDQDPQGAERYFRQALEQFPKGALAVDCRLGLARALEQLARSEEAIQIYRQLADEGSGRLVDEASFHLGAALYTAEQYEEAIAAFERFNGAFNDSRLADKARLGKAWALYRLERYEDSRAMLVRLVASPAVGADATYWLGLAQKALEQWDAASASLLLAAEKTDDAGESSEAFFQAADALIRAGKVEMAIAHLDHVLDVDSDSKRTERCMLRKLEALFALGRHEDVESLAAEFGQRYADSELQPQVQSIHGRALIARGRHAEAIALLDEKSGDATSASGEARRIYLLGLAHHSAGQFQNALDVLEPELARPDGGLSVGHLADDAHLLMGSTLVGLSRFEEAIGWLTRFLRTSADREGAARCRAELAISYARTGKLDKARETFGTFRKRHVSDALLIPTALDLGEVAYAAERFHWAAELFSLLLEQNSTPDVSARATSGLAWSRYQLGDFAEASRLFAQVTEEHADHRLAPEAALARGRALVELDRLDAALGAYERLVELYPNRPEAPKALLAAARLYDSLERDEKSAQRYEELDARFADFEQLDAALYEWAWVLRDLSRSEDSEAIFTRLHEKHRESPSWADATYRLAEGATQAGHYEHADKLLAELIEAEPEKSLLAHALYLRGRTAALGERYTEAVEPLERVTREFPDKPLALLSAYWLGEVAYRQQDLTEAARRFEHLAEQAAENKESWVAMVALRRAQIHAHEQRWSEAYDLATEIESEFPDFNRQYEADYVTGRCLAARAEFDEAREAYRRVVRSAEGSKTQTAAMAQWMIGETFFHQQEFEPALREYLRVEILYDYPTWQAAALLQAGKCQETLGRWRQAAELYTRLLKQFPDTSFTEKATDRLQSVQRRLARADS